MNIKPALSASERIAAYEKATGWSDSLWRHAGSDQILGMWVMGNDYRVKSGYYGGYPAGYLARIRAMFPEKERPLHLFSGRVDLAAFPGQTVDIREELNPDHLDNAETLEKTPLEWFDLVLADPPYSAEDAEHYGAAMVNRNKVLRALTRLRPGAHVAWLDQVLPMYRKDEWGIVGRIGMVKSTNHRFRVVTILERKTGGETVA
jgi:hypothetical protein